MIKKIPGSDITLIPEGINIAGFDNHRLACMPQIALTTVEHYSWQKGQNTVEMIHQKTPAMKRVLTSA